MSSTTIRAPMILRSFLNPVSILDLFRVLSKLSTEYFYYPGSYLDRSHPFHSIWKSTFLNRDCGTRDIEIRECGLYQDLDRIPIYFSDLSDLITSSNPRSYMPDLSLLIALKINLVWILTKQIFKKRHLLTNSKNIPQKTNSPT